ncbi:MAG: neutral zinc metallopeptidase [Nakamurella sp.]
MLALGLCAALLAGCASGIAGLAAPDPEALARAGKPLGYTPSDFPIEYAGNAAADQIARDALDDITAYYSSFYPDVFGHEFEPPTGGYFSIAPGEGHQSGCMDGPDDQIIEDNAFYCPRHDEVAYWRPLLARYAQDYSDMQVGLVLAHELGHTIQAREDVFDVRSIVAETQADCFAGVWAASVAAGRDPHFSYNPADLDETLLAWALELPSEVGSDPDARGQHGSAFDRVSALQEGYEQGPEACRDNFDDHRVFTQAEFSATELQSADPGNAPYDMAVAYAQTVFGGFYADRFTELGGTWVAPTLEFGAADEPSCASAETVSYCEVANTVFISDADALQRVHDEYGDFGMITAMGLAYGTAAIVQLGFSVADPQAMPAASCLTGAVASALTSVNPYRISLSPGDFDEATVMLLSADRGNSIVDTGGVSAFARMDAFRAGVKGGVTSCGVTG